jgi:hypothetical protein
MLVLIHHFLDTTVDAFFVDISDGIGKNKLVVVFNIVRILLMEIRNVSVVMLASAVEKNVEIMTIYHLRGCT